MMRTGFSQLLKRPSHVRTPSYADSLSETSELSSPELSSLEAALEAASAAAGGGSSAALAKLNGVLLSALRAERARSAALLERLNGDSNATLDAPAAPPTLSRAKSADAVARRSLSRTNSAAATLSSSDENIGTNALATASKAWRMALASCAKRREGGEGDQCVRGKEGGKCGSADGEARSHDIEHQDAHHLLNFLVDSLHAC